MVANQCTRCGSTLAPDATCTLCSAALVEPVTVVSDADGKESETPNPTVFAGGAPGDGAATVSELPGYELLGVLGQGGMGVVHRARQIALDRIVAIKLVRGDSLNETNRARFLLEARSAAKFKHPNIVVVYDLGQAGEQLFLVMEFLEGETLAKFIARNGRVEERQMWTLIRQAAAGLAHAEQAGIVHRDIKPENLFLTTTGSERLLKIMDFGLAMLRQRGEGEAITRTGTILGTPIYMAPEQFDNSRVDARADIYSLGITALHILSGQSPYGNASLWEIVAKKSAPLAMPNGLSAEGKKLLSRMISPAASDRPASHAELLAEIDRLLNEPPPAAMTTIQLPLKQREGRRRLPWLLVAAVLVGLLLAGSAAFYFRRDRPPESWVAQGSVSLFDGKNLAGWRFSKGIWKPDRDAEGGTVLAGQGVIARPLPPFDSYRVMFGVDSTRCTQFELQFGFTGEPQTDGWLALRVTDRSIDLGRCTDDGTFASLASIPAPRAPDRELESPYREVRVERLAGVWRAYYNGKLVGETHAVANERSEFRLSAEGGVARFEAIEVAEMKPSTN